MAAMIGITITGEAYAAIAATLPAERDVEREIAPGRDEYRVWLPRTVVDRLAALRGAGESYSDCDPPARRPRGFGLRCDAQADSNGRRWRQSRREDSRTLGLKADCVGVAFSCWRPSGAPWAAFWGGGPLG
jgi:hypothetical protein